MCIDENGGSDQRLDIFMLLTVVQYVFSHFAIEMIQLLSSKTVSQKMIFVLVWFFKMRMVDYNFSLAYTKNKKKQWI